MKNKTKILIPLLIVSLIFLINMFRSIAIPFWVSIALMIGFGFYFLTVIISAYSQSSIYTLEFYESDKDLDLKFFKEFFISVLFIGWSLNGLAQENIFNLKTNFFYFVVCCACLSTCELFRELILFVRRK